MKRHPSKSCLGRKKTNLKKGIYLQFFTVDRTTIKNLTSMPIGKYQK
jgi:hypothetical protein